MSNSALCSHVDALEAMLRKRIALDADGLTPWEVLPFEKRKIECDAELSSKSLGIMVSRTVGHQCLVCLHPVTISCFKTSVLITS